MDKLYITVMSDYCICISRNVGNKNDKIRRKGKRMLVPEIVSKDCSSCVNNER